MRLPSLKLTFSPLKDGGCETTVILGNPPFSGANCWFQGGIRSIWVGSGPHMLPGTGVEAPEDAELQGLSYGRSFFNYAKGKNTKFHHVLTS